MSKYKLLGVYFNQSKQDIINLSFLEIENILGFTLPPYLYENKAGWYGTAEASPTHTQKAVWCSYGYQVEKVDLNERKVIFKKQKKAKQIQTDAESIPKSEDYLKVKQTVQPVKWNDNVESAVNFTEDELEETARRVNSDPRYGEEATIINNCFNKFSENVDGNIIAMKIALIDMTNSTNLNKHLSKIYLTRLIDKIKNCNFDDRVKTGDVSLIGELAKNEINLFSFFSKYCLYHNYYVYQRDDFIIFDGIMKNHVGSFIPHYDYKGKI